MRIKVWMATAALALACNSAMALPLSVDPGAYLGQWSITGFPLAPGPRTFNLNPGTYRISIAAGTGTNIHIDADGTITSDSTRFNISGSTVSFQTVDVVFEPERYKGQWSVNHGSPWLFGLKTLKLVPAGTGADDINNRYILAVGGLLAVYFSVAADGTITTNSTVLLTSGNVATFVTTPIHFDPGLYLGEWALDRATQQWHRGPKVIDLVPSGQGTDDWELRYRITFGCCAGTRFVVDPAGNIVTDSTRASVDGSSITFTTTPVTIDPGGYTGMWALDRASPSGAPQTGAQTLNLVTGGTGVDDFLSGYRIGFGCCTGTAFRLDGDGTVTTNSTRAVATGGSIAFDTVLVRIDPGSYLDAWALDRATPRLSGVQDLDLVPGGTGSDDFLAGIYRVGLISTGHHASFEVFSPCAINTGSADPNSLPLGDESFTVFCPYTPPSDTDGDGINDSVDLCPDTAPGSVVNADGCSGSQYVAAACNASDFRNHGQFVSCVARAGTEAVRLGLLTQAERAQLVKHAARDYVE